MTARTTGIGCTRGRTGYWGPFPFVYLLPSDFLLARALERPPRPPTPDPCVSALMAGPKLDGAGVAKMTTLEKATNQLQRLNTVVEQAAAAVKNQKSVTAFVPQIRRAGHPLVGLLKGQFGMISDMATAFLLQATRGGTNEQGRVRLLREGVAQLRVQMELATAKTLELHTIGEENEA